MWIVYALLATFFFGLRGILYQWTSQKNLNRDLLLFGVFCIGFIISVVGATYLDTHIKKIVKIISSFMAELSLNKRQSTFDLNDWGFLLEY
ncbi:hypothetical protein Glaag_2416 [Glaciecola sp. 4H-3-7+YE-5]|nr:hypothetical protein Glaag_2416 [Glaciecola sp. 4H-3-7+YE-5]|tara:strand:- start:12727 stop:12999 length:273 start_codon:yes stop_codon:yes gene_type:complete